MGKKSKPSTPMLPSNLVERIKMDPSFQDFESEVYSDDSHDCRLAMRTWVTPLSPNYIEVYSEDDLGFTSEAARTKLHLAALTGDVLMACEILYCGASPDKADAGGITPISMALLIAAKIQQPELSLPPNILSPKTRPTLGFSSDPRVDLCVENHHRRLFQIAKILIEQHVNVNQAVNGFSLFHLACISKNWDIISLLLRHGAKRTLSDEVVRLCFTSAVDKVHFESKLQKIPSLLDGQHRPLQICPCWSGKTVAECHGDYRDHHYPLDFVCVCGTGKTYRMCCSQKHPVLEIWDSNTRRILHDYDHTYNLPESLRTSVRKVEEFIGTREMEMRRCLGLPYEGPSIPRADVSDPQIQKFRKYLNENNLIDPAFAYALNGFYRPPAPSGRHMSRIVALDTQKRWNEKVDEYIATGKDTRSKFEIERAAKIGKWNGAYIRVCEGVDCGKMERRDVETLNQCAKCKIAVYCGASCQKSDWSAHKKVCGLASQREQALPSQTRYEAVCNQWMAEERTEAMARLFGDPCL